MDDSVSRRLKIWTPLLFSLVLIIGMMFGFRLRDSLRIKRDIQTVLERNDRLEQVIDLINEKYVDTVNTNMLYEDAIDGILKHLDPHTIYIPTEELQEVNEDLEGNFFGIGVEFAIYRDTMQVTSVVDGGPADRAGMELGDQIILVGDSVVAGKNITSDRIVKMLRGKQYSRVFITARQPGSNSLKKITIKRDAIPLYSVEASVMLDSITGFIKIDRFSATTYEEFSKALQSLKRKGMKQLVLDLRQNPGGYLEAAVKMADDFLEGEKLLVYTKGRKAIFRDYKSGRNNAFESGRLAVLVDENSASASEILAGAVQDWDRGVIIGRRTFGKGLVQEQYEMNDGSAIRLTIAKYYTPSGRSIQRSFANGKDAYREDYLKRYESGELVGKNAVSYPDTTKYYTKNKRVVHGGIGIEPDIYVPYDSVRLRPGLLNMLYSDDVKSVIWDYYLGHRVMLQQYGDVKEYAKGFKADDLLNAYVATLNPAFKRAAKIILKDTANSNFFKLQMKAQLARIMYHNNGYYAIATSRDDMVQQAMHVLKSKTYSDIIGR